MTSIVLHATPGWRTVAFEQMRTVRLFLRRTGLLLLALYSAGILVSIRMAYHVIDLRLENPRAAHVNFTFSPATSILITLFAFLLPFGVWQGEDPSRRTYHWMMPVARHTHTLTRVLAGWVWLMAATFLYLLVSIVIVEITQRITGEPQSYGPAFAAWEWLVPFTVGTLAYMFVSAAAVGSQQPIAWIVGVIALYVLLIYLLTMAGYPDAAQKVASVYSGEYGGRAAILGRIEAFDSVHRQAYSSLARWLGSAAIWGAMSAALLAWVSYRRPTSS